MEVAAMLADESLINFLFAVSIGSVRQNSIELIVLNFITSKFMRLQFRAGHYKFRHSIKPCSLAATLGDLANLKHSVSNN
jgi:hypothetical protein